jgi:hypothetical protein
VDAVENGILRLEADNLRATTIKLVEQAAMLIEKSAELEKRISESRQKGDKSKNT